MVRPTWCYAALAAAGVNGQMMANANNTDPASSILRMANSTFGPPLEEVHYYYDQWPIGLAVSSTGRIFTCYVRGEYNYTLGVIVNKTAEAPFPTSGTVQNIGPESINTTVAGIPFGANTQTGFISVQALYITSRTDSRPETLWVVDTGRPTVMNGQKPSMVYGQPGGPKIVAINIEPLDDSATRFNDTAYATFTFPPDVHYPDSYMNDIRFDLRPNLTDTSGQGVAYIVDSSDEGRPGFIMLDLGTGDSWRRLTEDDSVLRVNWNVPSYLHKPFYYRQLGKPITTQREGLDGMQLSMDGERMYYSPLTSPTLYSIPTRNLRARDSDPLAELAAHSNVSDHGQRGADANGFEGDNLGRIYQLMPTENGVYYYDPRDLQTHAWLSDPRIIWPDSASVGEDGYLYMTINQRYFTPEWNFGEDLRTYPGAILRAKLPDGATKLKLQ